MRLICGWERYQLKSHWILMKMRDCWLINQLINVFFNRFSTIFQRFFNDWKPSRDTKKTKKISILKTIVTTTKYQSFQHSYLFHRNLFVDISSSWLNQKIENLMTTIIWKQRFVNCYTTNSFQRNFLLQTNINCFQWM